MKNTDLAYAELIAQIAELTAKAELLRAKETAEAARTARALAQTYGLTAQDLGLEPAPKAKAVRGPYRQLFRDPATGAGWAGRGRIPRWMAPHLANGKTKDDFRVRA